MEGSGRGDGILLVAKPAGMTSHDMVLRIRHSAIAGGRKVGHAGTLDPFATGLLIVLVGAATRVQRFLLALSKTYRTSVRFGAVSDTGDPTGSVTPTGKRTTEQELRAVLPQLIGDIRQQVPLTSAVKVGGERLYRKARRGEEVETPVRTVNVSRLELCAFDEEKQTAELELDCSSGTYVRQLVSDLGSMSGAGAYCETLVRTAIGPFELARADEDVLIPLARALEFLPERRLRLEEARLVGHGRAIEVDDGEAHGGDTVVRLMYAEELIALAERRQDVLKPVVVFVS